MPKQYTREERKRLAKERGILVDPIDEWLLEEYTWHIMWDGYNAYVKTMLPVSMTHGKRMAVALHHCIMGQPIWDNDEIDHIDRNAEDNRRSNLRYATKSENRINTSREMTETGTRNVYLREDCKYHVHIKRDGQQNYLGCFVTLEEAVAERDEWLHQRGER